MTNTTTARNGKASLFSELQLVVGSEPLDVAKVFDNVVFLRPPSKNAFAKLAKLNDSEPLDIAKMMKDAFDNVVPLRKTKGPAAQETCSEAALRYAADFGWSTFPANIEWNEDEKKFTKKSYLKAEFAPGGQNWGASDDLKQLKLNFSNPKWRLKCGLGLPTGGINKIFVLETDTKKGGHKHEGGASLTELEAKQGKLPDTLMAGSPSGSEHYYFNHPGGDIKIINSASKIALGIDVRGEGGMVVAPPTVRGDGAYRWLNDLPIADAPQWLIDLVSEPARSNGGDENHFSSYRKFADKLKQAPLERVELALAAIPITPEDGGERDHRVKVGHAVKAATGGSNEGFVLWDRWRRQGADYNANKVMEKWRGFRPKEIGAGTLFFLAAEADPNWEHPSSSPPDQDEGASAKASDSEPVWPTLYPEALYGLTGEVVDVFGPHTEADMVALMLQFHISVGNAIGRGVYVMGGSTRHHTNLYGVLVGKSAKSRKGTSADCINQLMTSALSSVPLSPFSKFAGRNPLFWVTDRIQSGLASGEGVIWAIRDAGEQEGEDGEIEVKGVDDKRLMLDEREFGAVLAVVKREGSLTSMVVRKGWDSHPLVNLSKKSPARCEKPHVSISGHITVDELRSSLDQVGMASGFANRFLFACVKRSKLLPFGAENLKQSDIDALGVKIGAVFDKYYKVEKQFTMDAEARELWEKSYAKLTAEGEGLLDMICGRADPQTLRLALIYAVLDGSDGVIKLQHLKAALALWQYYEDSARFIFGDSLGDPVADTILQALRNNADGLTRTQISDLFGRNKNSDKIGTALTLLLKHGKVKCEMKSSGKAGRPIEVWTAT